MPDPARMSKIALAAVVAVGGVIWYFESLPGLRVGPHEVSVVGCEIGRSESQEHLCRELFCRRALLLDPRIGVRARVEFVTALGDDHGNWKLDGYGYPDEAGSPPKRVPIRCEMRGRTVLSAGPAPNG